MAKTDDIRAEQEAEPLWDPEDFGVDDLTDIQDEYLSVHKNELVFPYLVYSGLIPVGTRVRATGNPSMDYKGKSVTTDCFGEVTEFGTIVSEDGIEFSSPTAFKKHYYRNSRKSERGGMQEPNGWETVYAHFAIDMKAKFYKLGDIFKSLIPSIDVPSEMIDRKGVAQLEAEMDKRGHKLLIEHLKAVKPVK